MNTKRVVVACAVAFVALCAWTFGALDVAHSETHPSPRAQSGYDCTSPATGLPFWECDALVAVYDSTDGANWKPPPLQWLVQWLEASSTPCQWYGVTCSSRIVGSDTVTNVTGLDLWDNNLAGTIPPAIGDLSELSSLDLSYNLLTGNIPPELGYLNKLEELWLSGDGDSNRLSGPIPAELGDLVSLHELGLDGNVLTGTIPATFNKLTELVELDLNANQLTGAIPGELGSLSKLRGLSLNDNQLTGAIPSELGNLAALQSVDMSSNHLSGGLPAQLGNLPAILRIDASDNQLTGGIPPSLGQAGTLRELDLRNNHLEGSVPPELAGPDSLARLYLSGNLALSGPLPRSLMSLSWMSALWFDNTSICEPPDEEFQEWLGHIVSVQRTGTICWMSVSLDGPTTGSTGITYTFSALVSPITTTLPITYVWETAGQPPLVNGEVLTVTNSASFSWENSGSQTITVTAENSGEVVTGTRTIALTHPPITVTVGPGGQNVITLPDGWGSTGVPPGTAPTIRIFQFTQLVTITHPAPGFGFAGRAFNLVAYDGAGNPITGHTGAYTISLSYDEADWRLATIPFENILNLYAWNGDFWAPVLPCAGCHLDTSSNRLVVVLDFVTEFALLGSLVPPPSLAFEGLIPGEYLAWQHVGAPPDHYEVWRSHRPDFYPGDGSAAKQADVPMPSPGIDLTWPDPTAHDPPLTNYYYLVRPAYVTGQPYLPSNYAGAFHFPLSADRP